MCSASVVRASELVGSCGEVDGLDSLSAAPRCVRGITRTGALAWHAHPAITHLNRRAACTGATRDSLRDCPGASVVPIAPAVRDAMRRAATAGCGGASRDVNMLKWTAMRLTEYAWREGARSADPSCPTISH